MTFLDWTVEFFMRRPMADWWGFQQAFAALLTGHDPYAIGWGEERRYYNPIWALVCLAPLLALPDGWQIPALLIVALTCTAVVARHFRLRGLALFCVLSSPVLWFNIGYGNIDWAVWMGLVMPLPVGLLFLAMKPQLTWLTIIVLIWREWRLRGRISAVIPLVVSTAVWIGLYGIHLPSASNGGNVSTLWPYGLIVGVPLALLAIGRRSVRLAILAGPLLAPYYSFNSLLGVTFVAPVISWLVGWAVAAKVLP